MYFNVGAIAKISIAMGITHQNKVLHHSHAWIHKLRSSALITTIAFHRIEVGNSILWPNNKKYGEKDEKKTCWLNLYPIVNHGSYKSQFQIWPLWRYFCKPSFTICTIHINPSVSDGFVKLCNDQSMFFHTILGIAHGILYLGQWKLWLEPQTY